MTFTKNELYDLTTLSGGKYSVNSTADSYSFCERLTMEHYENFPVASVLVPKRLRKYVYSVYSFARTADDISDELTDEPADERINIINNYHSLLKTDFYKNSTTGNPIFVALNDTKSVLQLPDEPFEKLLTAFKMDIKFVQPDTISDLMNYCYYSANPVGELILRIFGEYNEENAKLSDNICTALQLTNFWQDLSVDLKRGRIYIPSENFKNYKINQENLLIRENLPILIGCLKELIDYNYILYQKGADLINKVKNKRLKLELQATLSGGLKTLEKVSLAGSRIYNERPSLNKFDILGIFIKTLPVLFK